MVLSSFGVLSLFKTSGRSAWRGSVGEVSAFGSGHHLGVLGWSPKLLPAQAGSFLVPLPPPPPGPRMLSCALSHSLSLKKNENPWGSLGGSVV